MSTRRAITAPDIPITLPVVEIRVSETGDLAVTVDGEPYAAPGGSATGRGGVPDVIRDLAGRLGPIRVELTEADGTTYTDIETPEAHHPSRSPTATPPPVATGCFRPGEEVMVVVVVGRQQAKADGQATLRLPPALLARRGEIRLVGTTSGAVAAFDDSSVEAAS